MTNPDPTLKRRMKSNRIKLAAKVAPKPSKYFNKKTEINGIVFDSKKEAMRWGDLKMLEMTGAITDLQRQVKFELLPSQKRSDGLKERPVAYIADFSYYDGKETVVEDCKGMKTEKYVLKRKLMLHVHGITIKEI